MKALQALLSTPAGINSKKSPLEAECRIQKSWHEKTSSLHVEDTSKLWNLTQIMKTQSQTDQNCHWRRWQPSVLTDCIKCPSASNVLVNFYGKKHKTTFSKARATVNHRMQEALDHFTKWASYRGADALFSIFSSERVVGNGIRTYVNSKGKIPCTGRLRGRLNLQHCVTQNSEPNTLLTELFQLPGASLNSSSCGHWTTSSWYVPCQNHLLLSGQQV